MERPREFRRVVFSKQDLAEALVGAESAACHVEITMAPRIVVIIKTDGSPTRAFDETDVINVLCDACRRFKIPVPRRADKRILIDRARDDAIILQMSIGILA